MKRFKKILVGVDLSWIDSSGTEDLSVPNAEAVRQALWLAKLNSASVDFLFSLELSASAQQLISESGTDESTIVNDPEHRLAELVAKVLGKQVLWRKADDVNEKNRWTNSPSTSQTTEAVG